MRKIVLILLALTIAFTACNELSEIGIGCIKGKGDIEERTIELATINNIDLKVAADVNIIQGDTQSIKVTGHHNILNELNHDIADGKWNIDFKKGCFNDYQLTVDITVPSIQNVAVSGSGKIIVHDFEKNTNLSTSISGSGTIEIGAMSGTEVFTNHISGSGTIACHQNFPDLKSSHITISGSGDYLAFGIESKEVNVKISGSGTIETHAVDALNVNISGSGTVRYKGRPHINQSISGSGKLVNAN